MHLYGRRKTAIKLIDQYRIIYVLAFCIYTNTNTTHIRIERNDKKKIIKKYDLYLRLQKFSRTEIKRKLAL